MSEERAAYGKTRPAQFRLPIELHEFLARESAVRGVSKTDVLVEALHDLERKRFEAELAEEYAEMYEADLAEVKLWEFALMDGLEPEEW